jgi:hypothetical protein
LSEQPDEFSPLLALRQDAWNVLEDFDLEAPKRSARSNFAFQANTLSTQQQHVEASVRQALVSNDLAQAAHLLYRNGLGPILSRGWRADLDDRDQTVSGESIFGHLTVPRLEDMKRENDVGEHDEAGQWK